MLKSQRKNCDSMNKAKVIDDDEDKNNDDNLENKKYSKLWMLIFLLSKIEKNTQYSENRRHIQKDKSFQRF